MKYQLEYYADDRYMTIHLDCKATKGSTTFYEGEEDDRDEDAEEYEPRPHFIDDLLIMVPGLQGVQLRAYEIMLQRAQLFSWNGMIPLMLPILQTNLYPVDDVMVEAAPPIMNRAAYGGAEAADHADVEKEE